MRHPALHSFGMAAQETMTICQSPWDRSNMTGFSFSWALACLLFSSSSDTARSWIKEGLSMWTEHRYTLLGGITHWKAKKSLYISIQTSVDPRLSKCTKQQFAIVILWSSKILSLPKYWSFFILNPSSLDTSLVYSTSFYI